MDPHAAGLLLLTCLAGFSTSETGEGGAMEVNPYGPVYLKIDGVSVVTLEILYSFLCTAECFPSCKYTWTSGNVTTQGQELNLELQHTVPTETLTCSAYNPKTGESASVQKTLQVTAGPRHLRIIGPSYLTAGVTSNFSCLGDCYPSCNYTWTVTLNGMSLHPYYGDTLSLSPYSSTVVSERLSCEAQNTVSHLYLSTALSVPVASISGISIQGDSTVTMGRTYSFICFVQCIPSCTFVWKYMGKTSVGDQTEIPILHKGETRKFSSKFEVTLIDYLKLEPLTCVATNSKSRVNLTSTMDLTVIDPISVRALPQAVPVAGKAFSLQCVGSQNGASITWLKNKQPLLASGRVHFTPDNVTVIFGPLLQADDGSYQCVVVEVGGQPIQSVDYIMQVNYGPSSVVISGVDAMTFAISYDFQCSASCYPTCNYTWTWGNDTSQGPKLSLWLLGPMRMLNLTCTAVNPTTERSVTAQKTLKVNGGPTNVQLSGPAFLTAGVASIFTCTADCYTPCNFLWTVTSGWYKLRNGEGSTLSVNVPANTGQSTVVVMCKAQDADLQLYIEKALQLQLMNGPTSVVITGPEALEIGVTARFVCSAECSPSCSFKWTVYGETMAGSGLDITVNRHVDKESISCQAENTFTGKTATVNETLVVSDPHWCGC